MSAPAPGPSGRAGSASSRMRDSIGTPKARVLPDPVRARPHTSRPCIATGIASVWISNGWANPAAARPSSIRGGTPSAAKPVGGCTGGRVTTVVSSVRLDLTRSEGAGRRGRRRRRGAPRRGVASVMVSNRVSRGSTDAVGAAAGGDAVLLDAVRRGDRDAYVELYERHVGAARALARALLRNQTDADDVVSEVFASVLSTIKRGKGPRDGFRAYLMASVRNECYRAGRRRGRNSPIETDAEALDRIRPRDRRGRPVRPPRRGRGVAGSLPVAATDVPRGAVAHRGRGPIPRGDRRRRPAPPPQAVAAQAMRARRALGGAYLQRHITERRSGRDDAAGVCRHPPPARRPRARLDQRTRAGGVWTPTCSRARACREARDELEQFNQHLRTAPGLPLAAGAGILRIGLKARVLGALATSSASSGSGERTRRREHRRAARRRPARVR